MKCLGVLFLFLVISSCQDEKTSDKKATEEVSTKTGASGGATGPNTRIFGGALGGIVNAAAHNLGAALGNVLNGGHGRRPSHHHNNPHHIQFGNQGFGNQGFRPGFGNQGFGNQGFRPGFGNQGFRPGFGNQGFGNQGFRPGFGNQGFGNQGFRPGFGNQGFNSGFTNQGIHFGGRPSHSHLHHGRPSHHGFNNNFHGGFNRHERFGKCPKVRDSCPPVRSHVGPRFCNVDTECPGGVDKCCLDACIEHSRVCKAPERH